MTGKLMAFDLDGTILFDRGVSPADVDAIGRWQAAGNLAVSATGKSVAAARFALGDSGIRFDYHVLYTGCVIADADYRVIDSTLLDTTVVRDLYETFRDAEGLNLYATTLDTRDLALHTGVTDAETTVLVDFEHLAPEEIENHRYVGAPLWVPGDPERVGRIEAWLAERHPSAGARRNQDFLDVMPAGTDKDVGLARLLADLGIAPETWTVGDSWNDIGMHRWADHATCFDYSPAEVKEVCEATTPSVAELIDSVLAAA